MIEVTKQTNLLGLLTFTVETKDEARATREKLMKKSLDAKSEAFKKSFREFAIEFSKNHDKFLAEEIRFEYLETRLPKPYSRNPKDAWKAAGGIIQGLIKEGLIVHHTIDGKRIFEYSRGGERQMAVYRGVK